MTISIPIEEKIYRFLRKVLAEREYDLIVCGERKATAVLRALIQEIDEFRLNWPWHKVLSSSAIEAYNWGSFQGRKVLLFEELVHHGNGLRKCHDELKEKVPAGTKVYSAGFAVWEGCEYRPDAWYYAALDDGAFERCREEIIATLQRYGSLLLDTEHIELTAKLDCGLKDFFTELARSADDGNTFAFVSGAKRANVTIMTPALLDEDGLTRVLTPGSNTIGVVNKCRILERTYTHFSIIPILYPNTRCLIESDWLETLPAFVDRSAMEKARPTEIFYMVGLLASIELLRGVVSALGDLVRKGKVVLEVPEENFAHLAAMFPTQDIAKMRDYVNTVVLESERRTPLHSRRAVKVRHIPESKLKELAFDFLGCLIDKVDDRERWEEKGPANPKGESFAELFDISREIAPNFQFLFDDVPVENVIAAVAPDRLIDGGFLVTKVEGIKSSLNEDWAIRTFAPDAEIVTVKLQQQMAARGNPWR